MGLISTQMTKGGEHEVVNGRLPVKPDEHRVWDSADLVQEAVTGKGPKQDCNIQKAEPSCCKCCPARICKQA